VKRWWGPDGFSCPFARIDFREARLSACVRQRNLWVIHRMA
jgi:hypothetical protein